MSHGCSPYCLSDQINTGQADGTPGLDLNVAEAWQLGYTGTGVTIAIMDDGECKVPSDLSIIPACINYTGLIKCF